MKTLLNFRSNTCILLIILFAQINARATEGNTCCTTADPGRIPIISVSGFFGARTTFSVGDNIVITLNTFDSLLLQNKEELYLWIDGICYPKLKLNHMDVLCHKLYVKLDRDSAIDSPWNTLYSYEYYFKFKKTVTISVGTKEKILSGCAEIDIKTTESWMIEIGCALILGLLVLVFQMSKKLLKGGVPPILNQDYVLLYKKKKDHEPLATNEIYFSDLPYSLSRAQLLFWNLVVVISIIYIWMFTDELVSPTGTVLIIIGISGGTNLIGKIIDNDKVRRQSDQSTTSQVPVTAADFYTKGYQSRGFLTDILSDENGISIHRFQLVMFTIVFGIYFLWYMIYNLAMPQFNDTLLLLMGISSTTYAGVKITEK